MPLPRPTFCLLRPARLSVWALGASLPTWGPCRLTRLLNQRRAP